MQTIVCGVDGSRGARAAVRAAARLADAIGARLVAVHVLDRLAEVGPAAEQVAAKVLYEKVPDATTVARGEVGVAERLSAVARDEEATLIVLGARSRGRSRTYLRARCAAELAELMPIPILVAPLQLRAALAQRRSPEFSPQHVYQ